MTEYFIDKIKYRYLLWLHMNAAFSIGALTATAAGTMYLGYLYFVCGIFRIASYRIKYAIGINFQQNIDLKKEIIIHKDIIYAVDAHRKAMKFIMVIQSNFEVLLFLLIVSFVICLSLCLYRIFQILSFENNIMGFLLHLAYALCIVLFMFLFNYIGQEIMDHNNHIFHTAYNICWYIAPLHVQKIILLLLQRNTKPFIISFGNIFIATLEHFSSLMSASMSYFTVLYSTQQKNNDLSSNTISDYNSKI
ncbi:odorant receptor 4-like [Harpegnathos saltator]|uniref:odorant receptor 4-like n=1 Tax=Harpegnathos saltator TaxID=610380 RepID=UPI000DBEE0D1|nr:odorant receptor 4-like [Harpegnathos saltator]